MDKKIKISNSMQKVAVDILTELIFCKNMQDVFDIIENKIKKYELMDDPFTGLPCSSKDWYENKLEYDRQLAIDKYGHCDFLD